MTYTSTWVFRSQERRFFSFLFFFFTCELHVKKSHGRIVNGFQKPYYLNRNHHPVVQNPNTKLDHETVKVLLCYTVENLLEGSLIWLLIQRRTVCILRSSYTNYITHGIFTYSYMHLFTRETPDANVDRSFSIRKISLLS